MDDRYVVSAIQNYLALKHATSFSQYDYIRIDLDHDGWKDALVHLRTPYGQWCNASGCTVLVMHAREHGFYLAGEIKPVRTPFYISDTTTYGWNDLILHESGGQKKAKDIKLRFDGISYPASPFNLPAHEKNIYSRYLKVFP